MDFLDMCASGNAVCNNKWILCENPGLDKLAPVPERPPARMKTAGTPGPPTSVDAESLIAEGRTGRRRAVPSDTIGHE